MARNLKAVFPNTDLDTVTTLFTANGNAVSVQIQADPENTGYVLVAVVDGKVQTADPSSSNWQLKLPAAQGVVVDVPPMGTLKALGSEAGQKVGGWVV